uniref:Uncharacterized protein n=1 Tax=virus sp. ctx9V1 TaxID=2828001 RepID=A0A8S5RDU9_9VIRU|nr:MAG TPA: hypothetical protein [virus sp. ctx9V1]
MATQYAKHLEDLETYHPLPIVLIYHEYHGFFLDRS